MQLNSTVLFVHVCVEGFKSLIGVACLLARSNLFAFLSYSGFGSTNLTKFVAPLQYNPAAFSHLDYLSFFCQNGEIFVSEPLLRN